MWLVTKEFSFCYSHRLGAGDKAKYEGRCKNSHGHNAIVQATYKLNEKAATSLNKHDMVLDFNIIKNTIGKWVDENWDHTMLIYKGDKRLIEFCKNEESKYAIIDANATAEWMSWFLFNKAKELLEDYKKSFPELAESGVEIYKIRFYETPTSYSEYYESLS